MLVGLIKAGKVGETYTGLTEAVKADYLRDRIDPDDKKSLTIRDFLEKENKDRRRLLAEGLETTPEESQNATPGAASNRCGRTTS